MKNKVAVLQAVAIVVTIVCAIIIWFNLALRQKPVAVWQKYEHLRAIPKSLIETETIEWVDHLDTTYIDKDGILVARNKKSINI